METVWELGSATSEQIRRKLASRRRLADSSVRTILRRLERKGFLTHRLDGRAFVYRPKLAAHEAAARAVRQIIDRFCGGSVEHLLAGMVADEIVDGTELRELAAKLDRIEREDGGSA